jgi:type I restriction enzyme R subunit
MNNLYADWCAREGKPRAEPYAFKCTASVGGSDYIADLKGASRRYFVATTVELLTTGDDAPPVRNIVFFRYVRSPIAFYQMVGRGTRLDPASGKLMFTVYDYTNATRLFGEEFKSKLRPPRSSGGDGPPTPPEPQIVIQGIDVQVTPAGHLIVANVDGRAMPVTVEEYRQRLAAKLLQQAPTLDVFRVRWIKPPDRRELLANMPEGGRSALIVRTLDDMEEYDLFDVLAEIGYGMAPRTRGQRAEAFIYKNASWIGTMPAEWAGAVKALAAQFAKAGTEGLENPQVFRRPK